MGSVPPTRTGQIAEAWRQGLLSWKLDSNQLDMYAFFEANNKKSTKHVWNCSRQIGKSWALCLIAAEYALRHPGCQIKYAAPTAKAVKKIIRPHFREIFRDCPLDLRPSFHTADGEYRFRNGSSITVAGCDREKAESLRGQHAHLAIVDEAGFIDDLAYWIQDVLLPQTLNTRGVIIICSTPAKSPGHSFKSFCEKAEEDGTYIHRTIYHNPRLEPEQVRVMMAEAGGETSTTWMREYLAQHVTDEESAVIPEATEWKMREGIILVDPAAPLTYRPAFFDTYVFMDVGWSPDFTGLLFCVWDFEKATLIAEDEFMMRRMDTDALAAVLEQKTRALWGPGRPYLCISDVDARLIADLAKRGWYFSPAQKDNKDAAINELRLMITGKKYALRTHPRCKALRRQLRNATWNKAKTRFERTDLDGHFDLVDCLIYGRRHFHPHHDPTPPAFGFDPRKTIRIIEQKPMTASAKTISRLFGIK